MEFINYSHPSETRSIQLKREAYAAAARLTHAARSRSANRAKSKSKRKVDSAVVCSVHRASTDVPGREIARDAIALEKQRQQGPESILSAGKKDPFESAAIRLSDYHYYMINEYLACVLPHLEGCCDDGSFYDIETYLKSTWVRMAFDDASILNGLFLLTTRYFCMVRDAERFLSMALFYKSTCLHALTNLLTTRGIPDDTYVSIALILAIEEMMESNAPTASTHIIGASKMIEMQGGPDKIGLQSCTVTLLEKCLRK